MSEKWVILDAMGVIFEEGHDLHELLIPFIQKRNKNISTELIQEIYIDTSLGKNPSRELWNRLGFGNLYPDIEKEYLDTCLTIDPEFISIAKELKKEYSLAFLSNDVAEWSDYLRTKFNINSFFKKIIVSGDVKLRKPDKRIFNLFLNQIEATPENCVFVDDNLYNLDAASEIGIKTIRFVRNQGKTPFCSEFEVGTFHELLNVLQNFY